MLIIIIAYDYKKVNNLVIEYGKNRKILLWMLADRVCYA